MEPLNIGKLGTLAVFVGAAFVFRDRAPMSTWAGLAVILGGSLVIHLGRSS